MDRHEYMYKRSLRCTYDLCPLVYINNTLINEAKPKESAIPIEMLVYAKNTSSQLYEAVCVC